MRFLASPLAVLSVSTYVFGWSFAAHSGCGPGIALLGRVATRHAAVVRMRCGSNLNVGATTPSGYQPAQDGALTTQHGTPTVPPERSASASSMQSPPASAEATSVSILSPVFARPGAPPRSR